MDSDLEVQESKYISLYCSDYIRESIEVAAAKREGTSNTNKNEQQHAEKQLNHPHLRKDSDLIGGGAASSLITGGSASNLRSTTMISTTAANGQSGGFSNHQNQAST